MALLAYRDICVIILCFIYVHNEVNDVHIIYTTPLHFYQIYNNKSNLGNYQ